MVDDGNDYLQTGDVKLYIYLLKALPGVVLTSNEVRGCLFLSVSNNRSGSMSYRAERKGSDSRQNTKASRWM